MVKIVGKIDRGKVNIRKHLYEVKRRDTTNSLKVVICREYSKSTLENCQKTCDLLNSGNDNIEKGFEKKFFYFPTLSN